MSEAFLSTAIMLLALALFVSDRIRPDAVALIILLLAWVTGLVSLEEALAGFGSPAVIIVAAVLVVGRAVEYTGAAQAMTGLFVPKVRYPTVRLGGMTTLVGTPANLIISSVREDRIGAPFGMFDMTPVGGALALAGIVYLTL